MAKVAKIHPILRFAFALLLGLANATQLQAHSAQSIEQELMIEANLLIGLPYVIICGDLTDENAADPHCSLCVLSENWILPTNARKQTQLQFAFHLAWGRPAESQNTEQLPDRTQPIRGPPFPSV